MIDDCKLRAVAFGLTLDRYAESTLIEKCNDYKQYVCVNFSGRENIIDAFFRSRIGIILWYIFAFIGFECFFNTIRILTMKPLCINVTKRKSGEDRVFRCNYNCIDTYVGIPNQAIVQS